MLCVFSYVLPVVALSVALAQENRVDTPLGPVEGIVTDRARVFLGLPYAKQPVGALRWQPPQSAVPWGPTVLQAKTDPPGCPQNCTLPPHTCPGSMAESCLFLSVYTPRLGNYSEPAPVMLYIHGGNFFMGTGGGLQYSLVYDSQSIVNMSRVIVVTINYRLGLLGFLYDGDGVTGNYGLMDQEEALRWVQANIASFGGDPKRVTIFGQSAGAMSIASHLSRKDNRGLYSAAIMESDPFGLPFRDHAAGMALAKQTATKSGCAASTDVRNWTSVEDCWAGLSVDDVLATQQVLMTDVAADVFELLELFTPFCPVYGTTYLPRLPLVAFQAGDVADVPIIMGTVRDEAVLFIWEAFTTPVAKAKYDLFIPILVGLNNFPKISKQYPIGTPPPADYRMQMATIGTDGLFVCATRNASASLALAQARGGRKSPTYLYVYNHLMSFSVAFWGPDFTYCDDYICHGADLPQVFHPDYPQYGTTYTPDEDVLSWAMGAYWSGLAANGTAGTGWDGAPPLAWPAYSLPSRPSMSFETPVNAVVQGYKAANCDFWDAEVGYHMY